MTQPRGVDDRVLADGSTVRPSPQWTDWTTRFLLFTGKGGVGKTTVAAAVAIALADSGDRVLLVSTDPASNLSHVFQCSTDEHATPVASVAGLELLDLEPQAVADAYRTRVLAPLRGVISESELRAAEEQLTGACTVEVAAFDAFSRLLADRTVTSRYEHIVFDTAPTGQTLRLLELPSAWSHYLAATPEDVSCVGPLAGLKGERPVYEAAVAALSDPRATTLVLVARPERAALVEAARAAAELAGRGLTNQRLVINGLLCHPAHDDVIAQAYASQQQLALGHMPEMLIELPHATVPLAGIDLVGVDALRRLVAGDVAPDAHGDLVPDVPPTFADLNDLVSELTSTGPGVILVTGKGGVGKTSIAVHIAGELARRGSTVHLATTDPAGQLPIPGGLALPENVTISRIEAESQPTAGSPSRNATSRRAAQLEVGIPSPCATEVSVFRAFSRLLGLGRTHHVVVDTAATGHTLSLLDVTGAFHRQAMKDAVVDPQRITTPLMRLQNPSFSRVVLVTLAETTPVAEAIALQDELRRAGIEPFGWVVNSVLLGTDTSDRVLRARARLQVPQLTKIAAVADHVWVARFDPTLGTPSSVMVGSNGPGRRPREGG